MKIYITVKSTSKRKNYITEQEYIIPDNIRTLRGLLCELTTQLVGLYMKKEIDKDIVSFLTEEEIKDGLDTGRVSFDRRYGEGKVKKDSAIETMLLAFEDGLFRVFLNNEEIYELDREIDIKDEDRLLLIRFVMLAGSVFTYI